MLHGTVLPKHNMGRDVLITTSKKSSVLITQPRIFHVIWYNANSTFYHFSPIKIFTFELQLFKKQ